jgi:hypothetical protein
MLPTLEYVTDGVISIRSRTRINPHRISDHRFVAVDQGTHLEDHRPPGG